MFDYDGVYFLGETFYCSTQIGIPGKTVGTMFAPVQVEIVSYEPEKVGGIKSFCT